MKSLRNRWSIGLVVGFMLGATFLPPDSLAALLSRIYTFTDGSVLTASQLNTEFNNIVDGANALSDANISTGAAISPAKISSTIAGAGITRNASTGVLSVVTDNSTLEFSGLTARVKDSGITTAKINDLAVTTGKINDLAVTTGKIAALAITTAKIADGAVASTQILNSTITSDDLASNSVTSDEITDGAVLTAKIPDDAITSTKIPTNIALRGAGVTIDSQKPAVSNTNAASPIAIIRGRVNGTTCATQAGEGFSCSKGATGIYNFTWTTAFSDPTPIVVASAQDTSALVVIPSSTTATGADFTIRNLSAVNVNADFSFIVMGLR